ncbi:alpha/beta-hydrolase [Cadophora sp. DSE1049]|nr:alpha/beta-hydrolase [Cadophora sp. DSE1049]
MSSTNPVDEEKVIVKQEFGYGDHELQKLSVYHHFGTETKKENGLWIIYIHGGAWRDPTITDTSFLPTIRHLYSPSQPLSTHSLINSNITAFASLSYRLSPHPQHPQPPSTPPTSLRSATHPDHLLDILTGISFLQSKYHFGSNYLLIGHSCGATLAFQSIIRDQLLTSVPPSITFQNPEIVVGVAGIYDMRVLRDNNSHPAYQEFLVSAFGDDEKDWDKASPANAKYDFSKSWPEAKTVVVVSSSGDELVDEAQIGCMGKRLESLRGNAKVRVLKGFLGQNHDGIWEQGVGLADAIVETLKVWVGDDE